MDAGLAGKHHWALILPTSSRAPQQVYEAVIAVQYPMLCKERPDGSYEIGTGTRRTNYTAPTDFRYIDWTHKWFKRSQDTQADEKEVISTRTGKDLRATIMEQHRHVKPFTNASCDNTPAILAPTDRRRLRDNLQNAPRSADRNQLPRAQAATTLIAPLDMRGLPGMTQVLGTLNYGISFVWSDQDEFQGQAGQVDATPRIPAENDALTQGMEIGGTPMPIALAMCICSTVDPPGEHRSTTLRASRCMAAQAERLA